MHRRIKRYTAVEKLAIKFHRERLLFFIIGLFVTLLTFGFTMAKSNSRIIDLPNNAALAEANLSALAVDMAFEAKQVARDVEVLTKAITTTQQTIVNSSFSCSALQAAYEHRDVLSLFLQNTKNIGKQATPDDIYRAYEQYELIRGNERQIGIRQKLYGGYNPFTGRTDVGTISQLTTCIQIALTVNKSCSAYNDLTRQSSSRSFQGTATHEALQTLLLRCTAPNTALAQALVTVADLTPLNNSEKNCRNKSVGNDVLFSTETVLSKNGTVSCSSMIEKHLGPSSVLKKLKQIRK